MTRPPLRLTSLVAVARQPCLWNGFLGATPSHPVVLKALEQSVNGILNRRTIEDIESALLCPGVLELTSITR